jgi:hopanoid biosynthesis associated radical SAM protein HpnH
VAVSLRQTAAVGTYLLKQRLAGRKRYPLVLMLEPLFRCNLACFGCGKIDYPDAILNKRLSVKECLDAVDECGAPMVAIPGGEPLIHKEIGEIVKGIVARKKFVSLCTNALLLEKKLDLFEPSPYLFFSVHLDGLKHHHDKSVCLEGVFDKAVSAIKAAKARGFSVNVNCTIFEGHPPEDIAKFLDLTAELGVGVSISPGYAYERAPDQQHFLARRKTKDLFRKVFALGKGKKWNLTHSGMFLDFLAGNQEFHCTPWGMPTRNVFGWQKPCYLLGEGYVKTFKELMETTDWDAYGTDRGRRELQAPAQGAGAGARRRQDRRSDGAGDFARQPAAGEIRVRQSGTAAALGDPRQRSARKSRQGSSKERRRGQSVRQRGITPRLPFRDAPKGSSPESKITIGSDPNFDRAKLARVVVACGQQPSGPDLSRNTTLRHRRHRMAADDRVPVGPRPRIDNAGRRMLKGLPEIVQVKITLYHGDIFRSAVGHDVGQKTYRIGERLLRWLEPNHPWREVEQVGIVRKRPHDF